ncbi:MAG: DNA topoisomerase (ATP-hydrolyzing) subunit A [Mycoplasma sp.]|nr:DNA topoisomerase (ATP-hydrolyzing) subunit A [Mycoplasma sp.]
MTNNKDENLIKEQLAKTKIIERPIINELKSSFLEYSMSVIVARALPDARDGFKPVHRRVLYAAYGLGMTSSRPHKKSARLVGEVIGKYHPHGDTAVYETMVRMAQDFSMRYMLMDGHGNFGSIDGDGAAAMRYTETRMSKIADTMLEDINKNTVDFIDNYDGSESEPVVLPSLFPNLLANGTNGIAVGMATNIPPHNLSELVEAIKLVANNPEVSIDQIKEVLHGPDFPTGAQIIGAKGIDDYFRTGRGSVIIRAKGTYTTNESTGKSTIIFTEIPYQVNKTTLIQRIAELAANKDSEENGISGISDLRDESSREGIRIVIETKRDVSPEVLMNQLYKKTQLQTSFAANMLALVNGEPKLINIKDGLQIYIDHQLHVLNRRVNFDLNADKERQHILNGLHIAMSNIDEVVKIIRNSNSDESASSQLKSKFKLDDKQTKAILDMRLRTLSGLEREKIETELKDLAIEIKDFEDLLKNKSRQIQNIIERLETLNKKFGDKRRTEIDMESNVDISDEDLIKKVDILLTMSSRGYLKRLPIDTYRVQHRGGVGVIGATTYEDDDVSRIIVANTHTDVLIFTNKGKVYRMRGHQFPQGSRTSKGLPAISFMPGIEKGENVITLLPLNNYDENTYLFFVTKNGIVKKTSISEFVHIMRNGKRCITLKENDYLFDVLQVIDTDEIIIGASNGQAIRFDHTKVRAMGRTAAGVKGMQLDKNSHVIGVSTNKQGEFILSIGAKGVGKLTPITEYRLTNRNAKGVRSLKVTPKTGNLVATKAVDMDDEVLIITTKNKIIRILVNQIRETGRNASGVKLINTENEDKVRDIAIFKKGVFGSDESASGEDEKPTNEENN